MEQLAEITVKGYGNVSTAPDAINIGIEVLSREAVYQRTLERLNSKVSAINAAILRAGCTNTAVTKSYGVSELWTDQYDPEKRKLQGYQATQKMGIAISIDLMLLGRVFAEISATGSSPSISITFVVKDKDSMERDARINAVINARKAAQDLATASDLKLVSVKSINFTGSRSGVGSGLSVAQYDLGPTPEITPDTVNHEESVQMVWLAQHRTAQ